MYSTSFNPPTHPPTHLPTQELWLGKNKIDVLPPTHLDPIRPTLRRLDIQSNRLESAQGLLSPTAGKPPTHP